LIVKNWLLLHIKIYRGNFFFIISNNVGKILLEKTSGNLGFNHIAKRKMEVFNELLLLVFKRVLFIIGTLNLFIQFEGLKAQYLRAICKIFIKKLKQQKINILGYKSINKIAHNGCRKNLKV
jgi:ribosomal protein S11